jgi:hypothetical protein
MIEFRGKVLNEGGCSWNILSGVVNPDMMGYMVSMKGQEVSMLHGLFGVGQLHSFIKDKSELLLAPFHYLGAWEFGGKIFLDVSQMWVSFDEAIRTAKENEQIAMWDCKNKRNVFMAGNKIKHIVKGWILTSTITDLRMGRNDTIEYLTDNGIVAIEAVMNDEQVKESGLKEMEVK